MGAALVVLALLVGCSGGEGGEGGQGGAGDQGGGGGQGGQAAPAATLRLEIAPADQSTGVSPIEPVRVRAAEGRLTEVAMTNPEGRLVKGELGADGLSWTSGVPLGYGRRYRIVATGDGPDGKQSTVTSSFTTLQPRTLTFASMNPLNGQVVGVGQPIAVYFDEPIGNKELAERSIGITTTPKVGGAFYWFSDREVHWRPQEFWRAGTKVVADIRIYGRDLGNGVYGQEDRRISFSIGDAVVAEADGASHQMIVKINGVVARQMQVSLGKPAAPSSDGVHVVTEHHPKKIMDSSTYGVPVDSPEGYRTEVEWAVRISNGGEFVHSAPWSVRDQGHRNVSHGCVNASPENAKWFFDTVKKGDVVIIRNSGGSQLRAWDGFGDWQVPWSQWQAGNR